MDIINYFIDNPGKEYHVRELARLVGKSPTTVSKLLKQYEKKEILFSQKKFNHLFFKANQASSFFKDLKLFNNVEVIRKSGLVDYLKDKYDAEVVVLFGSYAKAENVAGSDVDILVVSSSKKNVNLRKYEKKIGAEIQLFLHSRKELDSMKKVNKGLLNNFLNGFKLDGYWEVFR